MERGSDSLPLVVEEEKHETSASIQALWLPLRCQARWCSHALPKGKKWPATSVFGVLGSLNTRIFRCSILGNVPTRVEAFPDAIVDAAALPKAVDWIPVPSQQQIACTVVQRGNVFTHGPSPCNPYVIQFSRYYKPLLLQRTKSGNARAKAKTRLTPWVETAGACGGLKPSTVIPTFQPRNLRTSITPEPTPPGFRAFAALPTRQIATVRHSWVGLP